MIISLTAPLFAGSFGYYNDGSTRAPVHNDPYVIDLNGDGVDEVIFGGLETQPNTPDEFSPLTLHVFGWLDGIFQDLSSQWLPNGAGDVQGVGDFEFADLNNDGRVDLFLAAYADMSHRFSPYVLLNQGGFLKKETLPIAEAFQHGSAWGDLNNDGYVDVVATGYEAAPTVYLGSSSGLVALPFTNFAGGSDIALGDFLSDGTVSAIIVDFWPAGSDTLLAQIKINSDRTATLVELEMLPAPRLENLSTTEEESHDVRALATDFNSDGLLDVVVLSRMSFDGTTWPVVSAFQLLQNQGAGQFIDVTAQKVINFESVSAAAYAPIARDFNQDGLLDFFLSGASYGVEHNSTAFLMQNSEGVFVDTGREPLSAHIDNHGGLSAMARGPDNAFHQVSLKVDGGKGYVYSQAVQFPDREMSESLTGTPLSDFIWGKGGNDVIRGLAGSDKLDGGDGIDTAVYAGNSNFYALGFTNGFVTLTSAAEGLDILVSIERVRFADRSLAIDLDGHAGQVARTLGAVFGSTSVSNATYVGIGLSLLDGGMSDEALMQLALEARLGAGASNAEVVNVLYSNVVGAPPSQADLDFYTGLLESTVHTQASLGALAAATSLNINNINLIGLAQSGLEFQLV